MAVCRERTVLNEDKRFHYSWDNQILQVARLDDLGDHVSTTGDGNLWKTLARKLNFSHEEIVQLEDEAGRQRSLSKGYLMLRKYGKYPGVNLRSLRDQIYDLGVESLKDKLHEVMINEIKITVVIITNREKREMLLPVRGRMTLGEVVEGELESLDLRETDFTLRGSTHRQWWKLSGHKMKGQVTLEHRRRETEPNLPFGPENEGTSEGRPFTWPKSSMSCSETEVKKFTPLESEVETSSRTAKRRGSIDRRGVTSHLVKHAESFSDNGAVEHDEQTHKSESSCSTPFPEKCTDSHDITSGYDTTDSSTTVALQVTADDDNLGVLPGGRFGTTPSKGSETDELSEATSYANSELQETESDEFHHKSGNTSDVSGNDNSAID